MRQNARVIALLPNDMAEVCVRRQSACSGECHSCSGCDAVKQEVKARAKNSICAQPGQMVYIESDSGVVLRAAALVYLLPLIAFLVGYIAAMSLGGYRTLIGAVCFVSGMVPALLYNRKIKKHPPVYVIVGFVD